MGCAEATYLNRVQQVEGCSKWQSVFDGFLQGTERKRSEPRSCQHSPKKTCAELSVPFDSLKTAALSSTELLVWSNNSESSSVPQSYAWTRRSRGRSRLGARTLSASRLEVLHDWPNRPPAMGVALSLGALCLFEIHLPTSENSG